MKKEGSLWERVKRRFLPTIAAYGGLFLFRMLLKTCTIEMNGFEAFSDSAKKDRCILMLWHNRLAPTPFFAERFDLPLAYVAFVSNSRDGEFLAALTRTHPQGRAIRVAHNARHQAIRDILQQYEKEPSLIFITPDGPRGPKYKIKPGIVFAAKATGAKIIPFTWSSRRFWELNTWDKLRIPKPFSKITLRFGNPVEIDPNDTLPLSSHAEMLEKTLHQLEQSKN